MVCLSYLSEADGLVIEDFFGLNRVLIQQSPQTVAQSPLLSSFISCAIACLKIEQAEALDSVLVFLSEFFHLPQHTHQKNLSSVLSSQMCVELVREIMSGVLYTFPRGRGTFDLLGDVLVTWSVKWCPDTSLQNGILSEMSNCVQGLSEIVPAEKEAFIKKLAEYVSLSGL